MFAGYARIRTTVLIATFVSFATASALAGPTSPLPPYPPGSGPLV